MRCPQCGADNGNASHFCHACGVELRPGAAPGSAPARVICPLCHASNPQVSQICNACGQLLPQLPGTVCASRYKILKPLGQGGMGRVYLVDDFQTRERRVLKEMVWDVNWSQQEREVYEKHFNNEAELQARLRVLRAVPALLDPEQEHEGRRFFVMEYIPGDDLEQVMAKRNQPLPADLVRRWAIQLCDVLRYLHTYSPAAAIVHRDITPDNIKLRGSDPDISDVALLDFGVARLAPQGHRLTQGVGKQGYAAPEQLRGRAEPRSDLYSLAATMHFLLTNRDPHDNPPPFPPPIELNPQVPRWFSDLITINLHEEPNRRYPSAAALRDDLELGKASHTVPCPRCHWDNPRHLIYCQRDGTVLYQQTRRCSGCQEDIPINSVFCPGCGARQVY